MFAVNEEAEEQGDREPIRREWDLAVPRCSQRDTLRFIPFHEILDTNHFSCFPCSQLRGFFSQTEPKLLSGIAKIDKTVENVISTT
jgi:hypothetical protein